MPLFSNPLSFSQILCLFLLVLLFMINDEASIILANISTFSGITIASKNEKYEAQTFQRKASKLAESG